MALCVLLWNECVCAGCAYLSLWVETKQNKTRLNIYVLVPHAKVVCCQRSGRNDLCILYFQCATLLKELSCALSAAEMHIEEPISIRTCTRTRTEEFWLTEYVTDMGGVILW